MLAVPEVEPATVSGITAMRVTASPAGVAPTEGVESPPVIPVARDVTALRDAFRPRGTVVAYKGGRRLGEPRAAIAESGALERSVYAQHLGTPDARVLPPSEVSKVDEQTACPRLQDQATLSVRRAKHPPSSTLSNE